MRSWIETHVVIEYGIKHREVDYTHRVIVTSPTATIVQDRFSDFLHDCKGAMLMLHEEMEVEGIMDSWYEMWFIAPEDAIQFKLMQP